MYSSPNQTVHPILFSFKIIQFFSHNCHLFHHSSHQIHLTQSESFGSGHECVNYLNNFTNCTFSAVNPQIETVKRGTFSQLRVVKFSDDQFEIGL